jgi:hypothetical protein
MKVIPLDASDAKTPKAFAKLLQEAIDAIPGHGASVESFVDSMVFGTMSNLAPPYRIEISGAAGEVEVFARRLSEALGQARLERRTRRGEDVEVSVRIVR